MTLQYLFSVAHLKEGGASSIALSRMHGKVYSSRYFYHERSSCHSLSNVKFLVSWKQYNTFLLCWWVGWCILFGIMQDTFKISGSLQRTCNGCGRSDRPHYASGRCKPCDSTLSKQRRAVRLFLAGGRPPVRFRSPFCFECGARRGNLILFYNGVPLCKKHRKAPGI